MGVWALKDLARARGGSGKSGLEKDEVSAHAAAPETSRKGDALPIWGGRKDICLCWLCREVWLGLQYIINTFIFKGAVCFICGMVASPLQKIRNGSHFSSLKTTLVVCASSASAHLHLMLKFSMESLLLVNDLEIWENLFFLTLKLVGKQTTDQPGLVRNRTISAQVHHPSGEVSA